MRQANAYGRLEEAFIGCIGIPKGAWKNRENTW